MTLGRKTGGRKPGVKNKTTDSMRRDIMAVYRKLGGRKWLLEWAKENGTEYVAKCLARVMPPMPREIGESGEPDFDTSLSDRDVAVRIAFILARATIDTGQPVRGVSSPVPQPVEAEPVAYTIPENFHDLELVDETHERSLATYQGSVAEHSRPPTNGRRRLV